MLKDFGQEKKTGIPSTFPDGPAIFWENDILRHFAIACNRRSIWLC